MAVAIALFAAALAVIASERVDRTRVALLGAVLALLTQTIDQHTAVEAIDWNTLGLLVGMMLMVRITEPTGVYGWVAIRTAQLSRGRPIAVVASLAATTAVLSAFLDNLTTVLLIVPVTFVLADSLDVDPIPLVIIEIVVSNIGGTATLIGDPPNILIAGATDLSFVRSSSISRRSPRSRSWSSPRGSTRCSAGGCVWPPKRAACAVARRLKVDQGQRRAAPDGPDPRCHRDALLRAHRGRHRARDGRADGRDRDGARQSPAARAIEWPTLFFFIALFVRRRALSAQPRPGRSPCPAAHGRVKTGSE